MLPIGVLFSVGQGEQCLESTDAKSTQGISQSNEKEEREGENQEEKIEEFQRRVERDKN